MPTYVYKFTDSGETIEVHQSFDEATLTELAHPADGVVRPVKKVFQPVGVTFKGSGFYKTDSRGGSSKSAAPSTSPGDSSSSGSTSSDTGSSSASSTSSSGDSGSSDSAKPAASSTPTPSPSSSSTSSSSSTPSS